MPHSLPDLKQMAVAIAENSAQGIVVMDESGYCLYANRAWLELTGFSADDMRSKPVHDWVHHHYPDGRPLPLHECAIGCTLGKHKNVRNHRELFFRKEGTPFHVECAASPILVDGIPVLKILEIRDVTQEVETERRRDEFLAMLAHELRNPLAPISAAASLLQLAAFNETSVRRASQIIARQVGHMTGLIDDLLDVSRVTRGQVELEKAAHDVRSVLADALEQIRPLMDAKRHRVALTSSPGAAVVFGDRKRLVQVFANLVGNAAKYTPDAGEITVDFDTVEDRVRVTVGDNGIGMTADMIDRAFELFTQAERSSDRSQGGLGIGLALVKRLIALHDGRVSIRSAGAGTGTTVTVELPRLADDPASMARGTGDARPLRAGLALDIMIVEDTKDAAEALAMLMRALGHRVQHELDPYAALGKAGDGRYDAFLIDVGLPGMDGIELARRLRQQPQHATSLLIAITGYGQPHDRQSAMQAGFDHHLVKPADVGALQDILSTRALAVGTQTNANPGVGVSTTGA